MMDRYDEEIRQLEERLMHEREALVHRADDLTQRARALAASPKGLLAAAAVGFMLGELSRPRRYRHDEERDRIPRKLGFSGVVGGVALALIKAQYGSPLAFGRAVLDFIAARRVRPATGGHAGNHGERHETFGFPGSVPPHRDVSAEPRIGS